jgi:hypothetical protein
MTAKEREAAAKELEDLAREFERWLKQGDGPRMFFADPVIDECRRRAKRLRAKGRK